MRKVDKRQVVETIQTLYPQGWTLKELAELLGISFYVVSWHMQQIGMPRRPRGRRRIFDSDRMTSGTV